MPSETEILGLPYPVGSDRVADGDNAMQALAERVESYSTAWTRAALQSGWVDFGSPYADASYRKMFGTVHIRGMIKNGAMQPGTLLLILPEGLRPSGVVSLPGLTAETPGQWTHVVIEISPEGNVTAGVWVYAFQLSLNCAFAI